MKILNTCGYMTFSNVDSITLPSSFAEAVDVMHQYKDDGILLFEGGGDIHPGIYNEINSYSNSIYCDHYRLEREISMFCVAKRIKMRMFGICRGHQLLATLLGGSLYQDILLDVGIWHGGDHEVSLIENVTPISIIQQMEKIDYRVNSLHHQAVKSLGDTSQVFANSSDGLIEGFIDRPHRILGVQWHPELMWHTGLIKTAFEEL